MTIKSKTEFSLSNFVSEVNKRGMSRPTHFEVEIIEPNCIKNNSNATRLVSLFCKNASLPQTRITTSRLQIFGPPIYRPVGVDYGGDNITLGFYVDQQMNVKSFFDEWVDGTVSRRSGTHRYFDVYRTSMKVKQLDAQQRVVYIANFQDVFPVAVNPVMLDHNSTGQVNELTVTFNYRRWTYETVNYQTEPTPQSSQSNASTETKPKTNLYRGQRSNRGRNITRNAWKNSA